MRGRQEDDGRLGLLRFQMKQQEKPRGMEQRVTAEESSGDREERQDEAHMDVAEESDGTLDLEDEELLEPLLGHVPTGSRPFDGVFGRAMRTQDPTVIGAVRLLLLYGDLEEALRLVGQSEKKATGEKRLQTIKLSVLGVVGGVAGALTLGPLGFALIPSAGGATVGALFTGAVAKGAFVLNQAGIGKEAVAAYSSACFESDGEFISILAQAMRLEDEPLVKSTVVNILKYFFQSRPKHPAVVTSRNKDSYRMILGLCRQMIQSFWRLAIKEIDDEQLAKQQNDRLVFEACEYFVMNELGRYKAEMSKLFTATSTSFLRKAKAELPGYQPHWVEPGAALTLFIQTSQKFRSIKTAKSAHEKLHILVEVFELMQKALAASSKLKGYAGGGR